MNNEQLKALNGLYTNNLVMHKYKDKLTGSDLKDIREKNKIYAQQLDLLGIPWAIQNAVAYASEQSNNWIRYNKSVIKEVIEKYKAKGIDLK